MENKKNAGFFAVALLFFVLAAIGGLHGHSRVPFWDMWDGYLGFYTRVSQGDWMAWWAQHNEHRIVLARVFFWLDLSLFQGEGWFLVCVNYALLAIACSFYWRIWKEIEPDGKQSWVGFFLFAWLFWWVQKNNLEWGFQSQFILAQLLPLSGFYLLHRAHLGGVHSTRTFAWAVLAGAFAIGSMANGILALPLMVLMALVIKMDRRRVVLIAVCAAGTLALYFKGYHAPEGHGSLVQALRSNPLGLAQFIAAYMGGPFSFGSQRAGLWAATAAGVFLIGACVFFAFRLFRSPRMPSLEAALLAFTLYVGGTALGTAGGRLVFGVENALSSRYMTPSLMAWGAVFFLFYLHCFQARPRAARSLWIPAGFLLAMMLPQQLTALKPQTGKLYERSVAALALELGVRDKAQIDHVFPFMDWALDIVKVPVRDNVSVFGSYPLMDLRETVGQVPRRERTSRDSCKGHLDSVETLELDPRFLRVAGWVFHGNAPSAEELIEFVDLDGQVGGYGLTGMERPDVAQIVDRNGRHAGFKGYVLASSQGRDLEIHHLALHCRLSVHVPTVQAQAAGIGSAQIEHSK